ncbi:unnamed protein product [Taenia asiatica]|uniref:Peptidase_M1_N domain-containing protein n=1 Tax=Taenia asiatica TaxID=60517 RepID=A0A0R3VVV6_TAEAS|nr:unnamed protein product [Taenia asiatica]
MSSANCEFERLPRIYEPKVYILELYPNAKDFTFHGKVTICMSLTLPTNSVVLNAKKIEIISAKIRHSASKSELIAPTDSIVYDEKQEKVTVNFDSQLEAGDADLCLEYKGVIADDMHGFYRSTYRDSDGEERIILSTQFESQSPVLLFLHIFDLPSLRCAQEDKASHFHGADSSIVPYRASGYDTFSKLFI